MDKQFGDWTTLRWAYAMDRNKALFVSTKSGITAGTVNEISLTHIRVGDRRVPRKEIVLARYVKKPLNVVGCQGTTKTSSGGAEHGRQEDR